MTHFTNVFVVLALASAPAYTDGPSLPVSPAPVPQMEAAALPDPSTIEANNRISENLRNIAAQNAAALAAYEKAKADVAAQTEAGNAQYAKLIAQWQAVADKSKSEMEDWRQKTNNGKHAPSPEQSVSLTAPPHADSLSEAAASRGDIVVKGSQKVCRLVGGTAPTGSLVTNRTRRVCFNKDDLARNAWETDRDVRAMVTPHGGNIHEQN